MPRGRVAEWLDRRHSLGTIGRGGTLQPLSANADWSATPVASANVGLALINYFGAGGVPTSFKVAFTSGTGGSKNTHELNHLNVGPAVPGGSFGAPAVAAPAQLFFQNGDGLVASWLLATNGTFQVTRLLGEAGAWQLMTAGDVDGDGVSDLLFQDAAGNTAGWLLETNGATRSVINWGNVGTWEVRACADYTGEGHDQIFFQLPNGLTALWHLTTNGTFQSAEMVLTNASGWRLSAAAPHALGGPADLYWQNATGLVAVWQQQSGGGVLAQVVGTTGAWALCGATDMDGDGIGDLLWETPEGDTAGWFMTSTNTLRSAISWGNIGSWKLKAGGLGSRPVF